MRGVIGSRAFGVAVVVVLLCSVVGGSAIAQGGDSDGVLWGCAKHNNGQLRLVADPAECLRSETAVSWNQTGIDGASCTVFQVDEIVTISCTDGAEVSFEVSDASTGNPLDAVLTGTPSSGPFDPDCFCLIVEFGVALAGGTPPYELTLDFGSGDPTENLGDWGPGIWPNFIDWAYFTAGSHTAVLFVTDATGASVISSFEVTVVG